MPEGAYIFGAATFIVFGCMGASAPIVIILNTFVTHKKTVMSLFFS
jgi:hypothetical protein